MFKNALLVSASLAFAMLIGAPGYAGRPLQTSGDYEFIGFTSAAHVEDGDAGFAGMHAACQAEFPELGTQVRMCTSKEFLLSPMQAAPVVPAWVHPMRDFFSAEVGVPLHRFSCRLWDSIVVGVQGFVVGTDGKVSTVDAGGANIQCNVDRPVTCCARVK